MPDELRFRVPKPVSLNNAYTRGRGHGRRVLTREGRAFKDEVALLARAAANRVWWSAPPKARLAFTMTISFPDRRRRDLDNCIKLTLDAIASALGFDDTRVDEIHVTRADPCDDPHAIVTLSVLGDATQERMPL